MLGDGTAASSVFLRGDQSWAALTNVAGTGFTTTSTTGSVLLGTVSSTGLSLGVPAWITTARGSTDGIGLNTAQSNVTWTVNSSGLSLDARGYAGTGFTSTSTAGTDIKATINSTGLSLAVPAYLTVAAGGGGVISYFQNIDAFNGTQTFTVTNSSQVIAPFYLPQQLSMAHLRLPVSQGATSTSNATTASAFTQLFTRGETVNLVLFSRGTGASSLSLQYVTSTSMRHAWVLGMTVAANGSHQSSVYGATYNNSTGEVTTAISSSVSQTRYDHHTSIYSNFNNHRWLEVPFAASLSAGNWWLAMGVSTTSGNSSTNTGVPGLIAGYGSSRTFFGVSQMGAHFGQMGSATSSSQHFMPGLGNWTTNSQGATTSSINMSQISTNLSHVLPFFQCIRV
jgi:hypothetical protein